MNFAKIGLTVIFMKCAGGYRGFLEEIPGVSAQGRTLDEAREMLAEVAAVAFDEERRSVEEFIAGKDCVREAMVLHWPSRHA